MIPASFKLPLRRLPTFFVDSLRIPTSTCTGFIRKNTLGYMRAAVVVAKKIEPRATRRNALKRLILPKLLYGNKQKSVDIVIRVKREAISYEKQLIIDIESILYQADSRL